MKMFAFRGKVSNFGDELNHWLWPKLLPANFFDDDDGKLFLGIGSILYDSHPAKSQKIVFGAGYRAIRHCRPLMKAGSSISCAVAVRLRR